MRLYFFVILKTSYVIPMKMIWLGYCLAITLSRMYISSIKGYGYG